MTLRTLVPGMLVGTGLALVLTVLPTWTKIGDDLLTLLSSRFRPVPAVTILPFAILWFGLNPSALIFVIVYAITWSIAINISPGFKTVNPTIMMVGRNLGLGGWRMARDILMLAAIPHIMWGLRTS